MEKLKINSENVKIYEEYIVLLEKLALRKEEEEKHSKNFFKFTNALFAIFMKFFPILQAGNFVCHHFMNSGKSQ